MTLPITIVMTYLNRKRQLLNTLASINTDLVKIIIVDDCSDDGGLPLARIEINHHQEEWYRGEKISPGQHAPC